MTMPVQSPMEANPGVGRRRFTCPSRLRRVSALTVLGVAALILAACGSSSSASTTSSTPSTSASDGTGASATQRQVPGASGTIAAINGTSLEVQNASSGQTTVTYTSTTSFKQTVSATAADVTVGSCISAFGTPTSGASSGKSALGKPVTAKTVTISQPTSGSCSSGFGGFGGGTGSRPSGSGVPAGGQFPGGGTSGKRPSGGTFPAGTGDFGAASGMVTAVNGSTVTVNETNPQTSKATSVTVTLTSSTTYTENQSATSNDLAVGKCAQAVGSSSSTGAITDRVWRLR